MSDHTERDAEAAHRHFAAACFNQALDPAQRSNAADSLRGALAGLPGLCAPGRGRHVAATVPDLETRRMLLADLDRIG